MNPSTPFRTNEEAIRSYGSRRLATWVYLKHNTRSSGGVVYRGFNSQRAGKFGWGRSKFFLSMSDLVACGLAKPIPCGWMLATTGEVIGNVRHKCTMFIPTGATVQDIQDQLLLKLMEAGHRQRKHATTTPEQRFKEGKISAKTFCKQERQRLLSGKSARNPNTGPLGTTVPELLKLAQNGWQPLNTTSLMRLTGMGRTALFRWKARSKERRWFSQSNRSEKVGADLLAGLRTMYPDWQRQCRGKFSWGQVPKFHQASLYKMNVTY